MKRFVTFAAVAAVVLTAKAGIPIFTADYYLANPKQWRGKNVTLAVAYIIVSHEGKERADGLRQLTAHTYNQGDFGGLIGILATPEAASKLLNLCGTRIEYTGAGVRTMMIQGKFEQEETGSKRFYVLVDR